MSSLRAWCVCWILLLSAAGGAAVDEIRVSEAPEHLGEQVSVAGMVVAPAPGGGYVVRDRFGDAIVVRTRGARPALGTRQRVDGVLAADPAGPVLVEAARAPLEDGERVTPLMAALLALAALVFIGLMAVLIWLLADLRRGPTGTFAPPTAPTAGALGQEEREPVPAWEPPPTQGLTMKLPAATAAQVQQGTVKVLPGRFEVLAGEDRLEEMRLLVDAGNPTQTFRIRRGGSEDVPRLDEILFTHPSVSSNQGLLLFEDGTYTVVNHADPQTRNPIEVNDQPLELNGGRRLADGDAITIGVVRLRYHAR